MVGNTYCCSEINKKREDLAYRMRLSDMPDG